ncbi:magnesium transporter [Haloarcula nitratireducens]|uniref:Magnesium transporter n=1 Tax=Haloarcula nitratireducens TaxID=2487749 RepID=A0AAW4PFE1_9EURY|nr:magnesium transporter [Halomicroarcula nitratireducens]MBX0296343.1 magnesium transporter [Halomicroarcula nitratireducens]
MTVREVAAEAYRESLPVLALSAVGGLFAGVVLGGMEAELERVAGLLVLVPALLATRGNVYGSLGARLGSALHQGLVEPRFSLADERVNAAVAAALANGVLVSGLAAVLTVALLTGIGRPAAPLMTLVGIALVAGLVSGVLLTVAVVSVVFVGYRRGLNPDTLAGPVVTTTGDVVGIATLLAATRFVLALGGG